MYSEIISFVICEKPFWGKMMLSLCLSAFLCTCLIRLQCNLLKVMAPVVQTLDSAIRRINHYPVDSVLGFPNTYPLDSDLSGG